MDRCSIESSLCLPEIHDPGCAGRNGGRGGCGCGGPNCWGVTHVGKWLAGCSLFDFQGEHSNEDGVKVKVKAKVKAEHADGF
jgi:hypothetical protein